MAKGVVAKVWTFESSSGSGEYETIQYTDGSTSCNCMGWTRRVAADGSRSCKHTRMVDQGIADSRCVASHDYQSVKKSVQVQTVPVSLVKAKSKKVQVQAAGPRKIQW